MISDQERQEVRPRVDDHTKLLYQSLAVEEVVGSYQEIPGGGEEDVKKCQHHDRDRNQGKLSIL